MKYKLLQRVKLFVHNPCALSYNWELGQSEGHSVCWQHDTDKPPLSAKHESLSCGVAVRLQRRSTANVKGASFVK